MFSISKIDFYHRNTNIQLSQAIFILCSVKILFILLRAQLKQLDDSLFSLANESFNRFFLIEKIKELLLRADIDVSNFSGYSLYKETIISATVYDISKKE